MKLWYVDIGYACFGVESDDNDVITSAAPIGAWMIGKTLQEVKPWLIKRKARVVRCKHPSDGNLPNFEN